MRRRIVSVSPWDPVTGAGSEEVVLPRSSTLCLRSRVRGACLAAALALTMAIQGACSSSTLSTSSSSSRTSTKPVATAPRSTTAQQRRLANAPRYVPPAPAVSFGCVERGGLPDARCTPGATDPRVTQANISATICVAGYTKRVRPSTSVTTPIKRARLAAYGSRGPLSAFELDHLIPLELGGAPAAVANLWPELWTGTQGARTKDHIENELHARVCAKSMRLATAQRAIATDWRTADR